MVYVASVDKSVAKYPNLLFNPLMNIITKDSDYWNSVVVYVMSVDKYSTKYADLTFNPS